MNHLHDACVGTRSNLGSLDGLREHLQWAIELEHSTIPPYMCALYSLDPIGNRASTRARSSRSRRRLASRVSETARGSALPCTLTATAGRSSTADRS